MNGINKWVPRPKQRAVGLALLALILLGSLTWFRELLGGLLNTPVFGDVDVLTLLSLVGLWVLWRLKQKAI